MSTALRSVGLLDVLSSTPAGPEDPVRGLEVVARMGLAGEVKARGGSRCRCTSSTTSNAEIARKTLRLALRPRSISGSGGAGASASFALLDDVQ